MIKPQFSDRIPRVPVTVPGQMTTVGWGTCAVVLGSVTATGGYSRWISPVYDTLKQTPGGPYTWGISCLILGVGVLTGVILHRWPLKAWSLSFLAIWCVCYGLGTIDAAVRLPGATLAGGPIFLFLGYMSCVLIMIDERLGAVTTRTQS